MAVSKVFFTASAVVRKRLHASLIWAFTWALGMVTFKNAGVASVVAAIGLEHLVLETDAPYLAPVPYRGQRNEPAYLLHIAEKIAEPQCWVISVLESNEPDSAFELFTEVVQQKITDSCKTKTIKASNKAVFKKP